MHFCDDVCRVLRVLKHLRAERQTDGPDRDGESRGDGATTTFTLKKTYQSGAGSYTRDVTKPVTGSVRVAVAGVEKVEGTDFTVDVTTGVVTFEAGIAEFLIFCMIRSVYRKSQHFLYFFPLPHGHG